MFVGKNAHLAVNLSDVLKVRLANYGFSMKSTEIKTERDREIFLILFYAFFQDH